MFEQAAAAIDALEIRLDGEALTEAFALLDKLTSKVTEAVGEFDAAELWDLDGATSMAAWLRVAARLSNRDASREVRTAGRLRQLPLTAAAWRD